jgi:tetratricopeptide (TPR) repeat protein
MRNSKDRARERLGLAAGLVFILALPGLAQYREYNISGKVVDSQKNPLAGVAISLRDEATSRSFYLKTKKDGIFKYVGLPHGVYRVVFRKEGFAEKTDEWKFEAPQDQMLKVEIPPVIMVSVEVLAEAEKMQQAAAGVKGAAEKVRSGDFDGALAALKPILEKNPKDSNALYILGLAYQKKRQWGEAEAAFLQVNEITPNFAAAHYQLGVCYQQMGESDKALACYGKAAELDPANPDSAYNSGLILFGKSQIPEALALFEKALALRPDDPAYLEMAGRCYIHKADFPKAIELLERAKTGYAADTEKVKFLDELIARLKEQIKK